MHLQIAFLLTSLFLISTTLSGQASWYPSKSASEHEVPLPLNESCSSPSCDDIMREVKERYQPLADARQRPVTICIPCCQDGDLSWLRLVLYPQNGKAYRPEIHKQRPAPHDRP